MKAVYSPHSPRRSHDTSRSPSSDGTEPRRRSISDIASTPRQLTTATPAVRSLSSSSGNQEPSKPSQLFAEPFPLIATGTSKRLGFLADKITSGAQLLNPHIHTHSRADSGASSSNPPVISAPMSSAPKTHVSPAKANYGRTYDSKLVGREMHRLAHPLTNLAPSLAQVPSTNALSLPAPGTMGQASLSQTSNSDPWGALHVHVLPLFNGEPLRIPIEDLNVLVKRHISAVVSSAPSKAVATLEHDTSELIASGMVTLNAKLTGIDDERLVGRVVETWGFFWDQVLTYVEGVLLPMQTDPLLSSLYRTPKRPSSPTSRQNAKSSISSLNPSLQISPYHIDVRTVALRSFRDKVILPLSSRLYTRLAALSKAEELQDTSYQQPRLQQMLLVLASQCRHPSPTVSLTSPPPQPTSGETAVLDLLHIIRSPQQKFDKKGQLNKPFPGTASRSKGFLSGVPRDRRGRIALKHKGKTPEHLSGFRMASFDDSDFSGDETPRNSAGLMEREKAALDALSQIKSPDAETTTHRVSVGGWGLGAGHEEPSRQAEEEDEPLDWDQAQAAVERMIGMSAHTTDSSRRRYT